MDIEVNRCLTALTSINYTSPIGLDCTSFTNKLLLQDQSVGDKKFQQNLLLQIQRKLFILTSKWFYQLRIIINQQTTKFLSSNPSQDQSGFFIPRPQVLRKEYTIQRCGLDSAFSCFAHSRLCVFFFFLKTIALVHCSWDINSKKEWTVA